MPDMPELETNDIIKGSKNQERDTSSIKESKNYAELNSLKQEENMQQQKLAEEEENAKRGFFARIFIGLYRAFTRQNKKPNKLDIEDIIDDEIDEDIENKINEKERTQEQQQANKQEKEKIEDFDVFATKKNKEGELKNRIEEIQLEQKVNKPVIESISDEEKPEQKVNKQPTAPSIDDEKKQPVMESISDEKKLEQKVNKQPVMESISDEKKPEPKVNKPVMESISDEEKLEQKVNKQPVMESIDDEKMQIQLEEKNNSKSKIEQKVVKSAQNHLPDDVKPTVDAINDEEEKKAEEKSDNTNKKSFFKKIFSFKFGKKNKNLDVEEISDDLEEQKSSKESISDEEKPEPKVNKQPVMESIDDEAKKTSTTVKEAISDDTTEVVQQSENKDNKISTFDDKTYYTNMYNGNVIKHKKEQDVFIEKLDKINQQSQENKVKSVVNSKFLEEFNAYITNDSWIIDNTEKVMEYNNTLYNSKLDNTKKNPEENFKFLEMCYQNIELLDKKGLVLLSHATENALQLTKKYGLEKVDEEKFKHFVNRIPESESFKKVFYSSLTQILPDVQEHIKDEDFKKMFKNKVNSKYNDLDGKKLAEAKANPNSEAEDILKYSKFISDELYISRVKDTKHDEIVRNTINNESLDKSWMFDFDHSKADVDKLLSNSDNVNNFINHLQHKKEVFSQPGFEHTYEDYYSVIRPETCVVSAILTHMDSIDGSSVDKEKARKVCMDFLEDKHIRKKELLKLYAETDDKEIQTVISNKMNKYIEQDRKNSVDDESILDDIMNSGKIIINALNKEGPLVQQIQDLVQKVDIDEFAKLDTDLDSFQNTNLYKTDAKFKTFIDKTISKQHELYPDEEEDTKSNDVVMQSSKLPEDIQESSKSNNSLPEDIENPIEIDDDLPSKHIKGNVLDGKDMKAISVAQTGEKAKESDSKGIQSAQKQKNNGMGM